MDIKIEEIKIIYTYNPTQTSCAFDEIISCVQDNQMSGDYTVVGYSNPMLNWIMQNGLYPLYKIQTITEEE